MNGNEMKFKPLTFWQSIKLRFWNSPPKEKVYIGTTTLTKSNWLTGSECELQVAMYKTHNPYTQEIYKVWAVYQGKGIYFNVDAYKQGKLIRE
jgi:hypothetical protein